MVSQPIESQSVTTTPADPTTPPATNPHLENVYTLIAALDKFAATTDLHTGDREMMVKFVRGHLNVPEAFLDKAAAALEQTPALQGTELFSAAGNRDRLEDYKASQLLFDKLQSLTNIMLYTVWSKKATLAADSFRIYGLSKQIALQPGNINTAQHVTVMREELGRKGPRKKKEDPTPTPTPAPTPQPPAGHTA